MGFVKLASTNDIKPNNMMGVEIADKKILLANINGDYFAIGEVCTHRGCEDAIETGDLGLVLRHKLVLEILLG